MSSDTMDAILVDKFVENFTELTPKQVPRQKPKAGEVEVRISHAALTHVDMLYALGKHQNNRRHVKPPFILGNEFAGTITTASPTSPYPAGTRVFGGSLGSYAQYICVPATSVRRVPSQWTTAEACAVGASGAISYGGLLDVGRLQKGETVLVLGATGGLGVMAVQIAKAVGASVVVPVAGGESSEKGRMMRAIGADVVVDYEEAGWEERVRAATTEGEGVDLVYDGIGAVESGIKCLRYRGRLVIVGFAARGGSMEGVGANRILLKGVTVVGYRFGEDGRRFPHKTVEAWEGFMKLVDAGKIRPVIFKDRTYKGLKELPVALDDLHNRRVWGRAVLEVSSSAEKEEEGMGDKKGRRSVGRQQSRL